jgi:hypothetical protein
MKNLWENIQGITVLIIGLTVTALIVWYIVAPIVEWWQNL